MEGIPAFPERDPDLFPIVHPRAAEIFVVERKTQRLDEVQVGIRRETEPGDVAGVGRDFGFDEDDVKPRSIRGFIH